MHNSKLIEIKEVMQRKVFTIYPDQSVFDAAVLMASKNIGVVPVIKNDGVLNGVLAGIISDRDIVTKCLAIGKDPKKTKIFECMTTNPYRIVPSANCEIAAKLMSELGVRRLPVVDKDRLIGMVSISDIAFVCAECPNKRNPDPDCILIDFAKELGKTSHHECEWFENKEYSI